jgi:hypothetical protein
MMRFGEALVGGGEEAGTLRVCVSEGRAREEAHKPGYTLKPHGDRRVSRGRVGGSPRGHLVIALALEVNGAPAALLLKRRSTRCGASAGVAVRQ